MRCILGNQIFCRINSVQDIGDFCLSINKQDLTITYESLKPNGVQVYFWGKVVKLFAPQNPSLALTTYRNINIFPKLPVYFSIDSWQQGIRGSNWPHPRVLLNELIIQGSLGGEHGMAVSLTDQTIRLCDGSVLRLRAPVDFRLTGRSLAVLCSISMLWLSVFYDRKQSTYSHTAWHAHVLVHVLTQWCISSHTSAHMHTLVHTLTFWCTPRVKYMQNVIVNA